MANERKGPVLTQAEFDALTMDNSAEDGFMVYVLQPDGSSIKYNWQANPNLSNPGKITANGVGAWYPEAAGGSFWLSYMAFRRDD